MGKIKCSAIDFAAFCLVGVKALIRETEKGQEQLAEKLDQSQKKAREIAKEIELFHKEGHQLGGRLAHEQSHFGREILDLVSHDYVVKVEIIKNGLRVTTKPIGSFKGIYAYEIDLIINGSKPLFRIVGQQASFQLKCLDGSGHDRFETKLLAEARLAEAAIVAIDLIGYGVEGGPYEDQDDNQGYY